MPSYATNDDDEPVRARIPADLDTPDQLVAGFTPGQVLTLVVLGAPVVLAWQVLAGRVPTPYLIGCSIPVLAGALSLVLARRDGLPLDRWLLAAVRYQMGPRLMRASTDLSPGFGLASGTDLPREVPGLAGRAVAAPLAGVTEEGVLIHADGRHSALIACTNVPTALSTNRDDAILAAGMARWLNSLSGPVQIVVRSRPTDLAAMANALTLRANQMENPALAELALDHAEALLDSYETDRPLHRTILISCSGGVSSGPEQVMQNLAAKRQSLASWLGRFTRNSGSAYTERTFQTEVFVSPRAMAETISRAQRTVGELQALGARVQILDGGQVQQVLADSWTPCLLRPGSWSADLVDPAGAFADLTEDQTWDEIDDDRDGDDEERGPSTR